VRDPIDTAAAPGPGRVSMLEGGRARLELLFDFPFDEGFNEAVRELPGRWFDWRRKVWRVPADARIVKEVGVLLGRFPALEVEPEVRAWLSESRRWRALVSVVARDGGGAFILRTLAGEPPEDELEGAIAIGSDRLVLAFGSPGARRLPDLRGVELDDLARPCARELAEGRTPPPAELALEVGDEGEPEIALYTLWDSSVASAYRELPEARPRMRDGRFFNREASWAVAVPADAALAKALVAFVRDHPELRVEERVALVLRDLEDEHDEAATTVDLSYADDAELDGLELGGELHPFQRAGVRYALARRRTFIADEQGLGKTIQALATLEADGAFPAVVLCPASMKLIWEREAGRWLPGRSVAVVEGRQAAAWTPEVERAEIAVLNYDILEAHANRIRPERLRALVLDESHYVKNPGARRTKVALALAGRLPDDSLRLALTGTPILNRPEELVAQLRILGRLREFGSGARLSRRFRAAASDDRLHWNLRATGYLRRTKRQVLPQLPAKRNETVPVLLSNEHDYRLAEQDVIAWLQTLPLDLRAIDARVAAALRAEQLVRLNALRQLAVAGKLPTALAWISDFLASGEALVVFADHLATQRALMERFGQAAHILGSDPARARRAAVDAFQREDGPQLIVCSMRAASQGITLTRASNVAFLELDWTPARHDQAEDRLHRIGQESAVTAWYLLAPDTIDETMAELLQRKRSLIDAVTDGEVRDEQRMVDAVVEDLRGRPFRHLRVVA
jgi:superfamily II DNA or RNA helicase